MSAFRSRLPGARALAAGGAALLAVLASFACGEGTPEGGADESASSGAAHAAAEGLAAEGLAGGAAGAGGFAAADYVGSATCLSCHAEEGAAWGESHHAAAMLPVEEQHMLGAFDGREVEHRGSTARFRRDGERYLVRTEDGDGALREFEVQWAFGVEPLQQYLVEGERGRMQVLPWCWDTRPEEQGGQRWFHLYQDEAVPPGDMLHWAGPQGEWNFMCADCHATALRPGYDEEEDAYHTEWEEAGVGCESCHGPGAAHLAWAEAGGAENDDAGAGNSGAGRYGLLLALGDRDGGQWIWNQEERRPKRTVPRSEDREVQVCAPCHSRRSALTEGFTPTADFLDQFRPEFLEPGLYHPDGAILEEVYVWGSFVHSRMYHEGVRCTDCHDPHSGRPRLPGDALCTQCHAGPVYDVPEHEHHAAGGPGASCVDCHMPERTYMVVDSRRDHAFRIPRPDLATRTGSPSACMQCHADEGEAWAAEAVAEWRGGAPPPAPSFGGPFHAAEIGDPAAAAQLDGLLRDPEQPAMVRASALLRLMRLGGPRVGAAVAWAAEQPEPMVRLAAARAADSLPGEMRMTVLGLMEDPLRAVRVEAARSLAPLFAGMDSTSAARPEGDRALEGQVFAEYREALAVRAGRAQGQVERALLDDHLGRSGESEAQLRRALELDPNSVAAAVNLADLLRREGRDGEALTLLEKRRAHHLEVNPAAGVPAGLDEAYALALVRAGRSGEAHALLRGLAAADATTPRAHYLWAVALLSAERGGEALTAFERGLQDYPWDPGLLQGAADAATAVGLDGEAAAFRARLQQVRETLQR